MDPANDEAIGANLLRNGDFEEGVLSPWLPSVSSPAQGSIRVDQGAACTQILAPGKNSYDILLRQRPIAIKRHREYVVRIKARSTGSGTLRPQISLVGSPSHELWSALVEVGPKEQSLAARIKISEPTNADAEFVIHMGGPLQRNTPVTICLDSVVLEDPDQRPLEDTAILPRVRVNQVGYVPLLPKFATLKSTQATPLDWALLDSEGSRLTSGKTQVFGEDRDAAELVHQIDFSFYQQAGHALRLRVGGDNSGPFDIGRDIFHKLKYDAFGFFYQQRCGTNIIMPYVGAEKWTHPAGHMTDKKVHCAADTQCNYSLDVSGGWYDAGDHGKYVVNGGIAVWTLLNWYERTQLFGTSIGDFADGKFSIPENANGLPDLLDEVRWELEFLMRMQVPKGNTLAGMVHHKIHSEKWTPVPTAPHADNTPRFLKAPSTAATLNLAAVGAQCARIYRAIDSVFAAQCLASAERAWQAAELHPNVYAPGNDREGGGPYGDTDISDEKYWAAAELFITTGSTEYLRALRQSPHFLRMPTQAGGGVSSFSWANVAGCGTVSLAVLPSNLPRVEIDLARKNIVNAARLFSDATRRSGYKVPMPAVGGRYPWGSNSLVLNNGVVLALAYDFTKQTVFLNGAVDALDYILGRNPMAKSYVTSFGSRSMENPHHRFWAHQSNPSFPSPPPGVVAGGPNSGVEDPSAQASGLAGCAPQKCYLDDIESWSTNEVAINWNAPLAWLSAFLDEKAHE
jgi:endoglucanase